MKAMGIICIIWGILALVGMAVGIIPCLGALNYLVIPFSSLGFIVSLVALIWAIAGGSGNPGKKLCLIGSIVGLICCAITPCVGVVRLIMGAGIL